MPAVSERVDARSFEAIEYFRAAVIRFVETANASLTSADIEISRTLNWLETEQMPHWKAMLRTTANDLEKARTAYREKRFYKDASGARHSGIDELKTLRKVEAKRAQVEKRDKATRRNLRQLQRDLALYHAGAHQLRSMVNGTLPVAVEELRGVVEQLERYVHAVPEAAARSDQARAMGREPSTAPPGSPEADSEEQATAALDEATRRRTPGPKARSRAARSSFLPLLPEVPRLALQAMSAHLPEAPQATPGRYDLVTTTLSPDDAGGDLYLERCEPTAAGDSGWHLGPDTDATSPGPCVTITVGRIASERPELGRLLSLPAGWLLKAAGGRLVRIVDPLGRTLWRDEAPQSSEGEG